MQTQKTGLDFKGQNIFVGIDVHLKSWAVTILTENLVHKTFTQPACADTLSNYLNRNFPYGDYYSVYECLFQSKSIPVVQSKSIPFKLNKKGSTHQIGVPRSDEYWSPDFLILIFHFFIISVVSLKRYDSPFMFTK